MESGLASDTVGVICERDTSVGNDVIEIGERVEVTVCQGLVDVGPERLCRLQFR
nr:hypothetical protein [Tropicimonas sp. IMCC6043]